MKIREFGFFRRSNDERPYKVVKIDAGKGRALVEITESPECRTAYVYVNGSQVYP